MGRQVGQLLGGSNARLVDAGEQSLTIRPVSQVWATHMKTTIELPDDLLERSKAVARRENSTLKALIEEGLRLALRARSRRRGASFAVQPFHGDGLTPEFADAGWEKIRDEIYRDRG
jgi:hypothetical protein